MKILITGSNGLLGQKLVHLLSKDSEVELVATARGENRLDLREGYRYVSMDITQQDEVDRVLTAEKPAVMIHTAAMTNVDACENNRESCYNLNVNLVKNLTDYCVENKTHLIHLSTDFIFDGVKGNYTEEDKPNPLSYYGETKLLSEKILQNSTLDFTILRTILVYGLVNDMSRSNIVLWVKESLENKKEITIVDDQFRTPTYVEDLALACKLSIDKKAKGVYHVSSCEMLSIYEIANEIAITFQLDKSLIKPISTSILNQTAPRPVRTGFDLTKIKRDLSFNPKTFKEDLQRFKLKLM